MARFEKDFIEIARRAVIGGAAAAAMLSFPLTSWGASTTGSLNMTTTIAARASLSISPSTVTFADSDPDLVPSVPATENPVTITAKVRTGSASNATLTAQAGGDLVSGSNTIAIGNITWTVASGPFIAGTMNKTTGQGVSDSTASWTGSGIRTGTIKYFFANSWSYATGAYTATATYTLTAP